MTSPPARPYSLAPSVLLVAHETAGLFEEVGAAGYQLGRVVDPSTLAQDAAIPGHDPVVVSLDEPVGDELLDELVRLDGEGVRLVVCFPDAALASVADRLGATGIALLSDPAPGELAGLLTLLRLSPRDRLHDSGVSTDSLRLQLLADQVSRIARTLAEMTEGEVPLGRRGGLRSPTDDFSPTPRVIATDAPVTAKAVRAVIAERRLRGEFLNPELFGEPAWDMLLDLYAARLEHIQVSVSSLCIAAAVPSTTALRWLQTLTVDGLVKRRADPRDKRRVFVELGDEAAKGMNGYFGALAA